jgi:phosphatidate cytidylyltransferase
MGTLLKRTLSSIVFVLLILGPLFLSVHFAFWVYVALGLLTVNEIVQLTGTDEIISKKGFAAAYYLLFTYASYNYFFAEEIVRWPFLAMSILLLASFVIELFKTGSTPFNSIATALIAPIFASASFLALPYFMAYRTDLPNLWITISVFSLIWINDSGAYLIGRTFGKTKLFERLSPNKTWEGSVGGLICGLAAGISLGFIPGMPSKLFMAGFAGVCIVFGSLGDLFESRMKRAAGVKDSGIFLPGHGGFFDRFDAMMLAVPAAIIYFEIFLPKP